MNKLAEYVSHEIDCPICYLNKSPHLMKALYPNKQFRACNRCWNGWYVFENMWGLWIRHAFNKELYFLIIKEEETLPSD